MEGSTHGGLIKCRSDQCQAGFRGTVSVWGVLGSSPARGDVAPAQVARLWGADVQGSGRTPVQTAVPRPEAGLGKRPVTTHFYIFGVGVPRGHYGVVRPCFCLPHESRLPPSPPYKTLCSCVRKVWGRSIPCGGAGSSATQDELSVLCSLEEREGGREGGRAILQKRLLGDPSDSQAHPANAQPGCAGAAP